MITSPQPLSGFTILNLYPWDNLSVTNIIFYETFIWQKFSDVLLNLVLICFSYIRRLFGENHIHNVQNHWGILMSAFASVNCIVLKDYQSSSLKSDLEKKENFEKRRKENSAPNLCINNSLYFSQFFKHYYLAIQN